MSHQLSNFDPLISSAFQSNSQLVWGLKHPTLLQSRRAVHSSPETLVESSDSVKLRCQIPSNGLHGVVHGISDTYWASTKQYLFLLGQEELLLPPLGDVSTAVFVGSQLCKEGVIYGAVASTNTVSILKIVPATNSVTVQAVCKAENITHLSVSRIPSSEQPNLELVALGNRSNTAAVITVGLESENCSLENASCLTIQWFTFPSTLYQKVSVFFKPTVQLHAFDINRSLLSTLDSSNVLRMWQLSNGNLQPAATGTYPDPVPPIALCCAGDADDFLLVAINKQGGRDIFIIEQWIEPSIGLNHLKFQRQVLAPEGCNMALQSAYYSEGLTLYAFEGNFMASTVAPAFVEPNIGPHEVVDATLFDHGDRLATLVTGDGAMCVVTQNGTVFRLRKRNDFHVFSDMLLDDPQATLDVISEGGSEAVACKYLWQLLPAPNIVSIAQDLISPKVNLNTVTLTPFILTIAEELDKVIASCKMVSTLSNDLQAQLHSISILWERLLSNFEILFKCQGWCDTSFVDNEIIELEVSETLTATILNKISLSYSMAASLQGVVLSAFHTSIKSANLLYIIWSSATVGSIPIVPASRVDWGTANRCDSNSVRQLIFELLGSNLSVGLPVLRGLLKIHNDFSEVEGLGDIPIVVRVLGFSHEGQHEESLSMLDCYTASLHRIHAPTIDFLVERLSKMFSGPLSVRPKVRSLASLLSIPGYSQAKESRAELFSIISNCQGETFDDILLKTCEWMPEREVRYLAYYLESFSITDDRLRTVARHYEYLKSNCGYSLKNSPVLTPMAVLVALVQEEPSRSTRLAAIARSAEGLPIKTRAHLLSLGDPNSSDIIKETNLLSIQRRLWQQLSNTEGAQWINTCNASPTELFECCSEVVDANERSILQAELLNFMPDADDTVVFESLSRALELMVGANDFCNIIFSSGFDTFANRYPMLARLIVTRRDADEVVALLCASPSWPMDSRGLFDAIVGILEEVDGDVPEGLVPTLFMAAQSAKSFIQGIDEQNQCSAVLEDRASRLLQAATFGQVAMLQSDVEELVKISAKAWDELQPVGLYSESTIVL